MFTAIGTDSVEIQIVIGKGEAVGFGYRALALFNDRIHELHHLVALQTNQVVVMIALIHLENRMPAFEMVTGDQAGRLELGQHAIHRCQTDILTLLQQGLVDIFRAQMVHFRVLQDLENLDARQGDLQPGFFQLQVFQAIFLRYDGPRSVHAPGLRINQPSGRPFLMQRRFILPIALISLNLSACSVVDWLVYKVPVQQGNYIEQKQVDLLKVGMTKAQVNYILGTPLIVDTYNPDRWDYIYSFHYGNHSEKERRLSVFFKNDRLAALSGNLHPGAATPSEPKPVPDENQPKPVDNTAG